MGTDIQQNDMLLAFKALSIMPGLTEAARRVGATIIDHFNRRTGQCDPSIDRLVRLLGLSRATVLRATAALDAAGLILRKSHGGKSNRTAYAPQWQRFRQAMDAWSSAMRKPKVSKVRPEQSHECDGDSLTHETQTCPKNLFNEPIPPAARKKKRLPAPQRRRKPQAPCRNQQNLLLPIPGGLRKGEAARNAAERRWNDDLMRAGGELYAMAADWMTPDRQELVTSAEVERKGGGFALILSSLRLQMCSASGAQAV